MCLSLAFSSYFLYTANTLDLMFDDKGDVYVDGELVQKFEVASKIPQRLFIKNKARLISIKVTKPGGQPRLFATSNFGVESKDGQWKCTETRHENWTSPWFDESRWPTASLSVDTNIVMGKLKKTTWIKGPTFSAGVLYCRRRIGKPLCK